MFISPIIHAQTMEEKFLRNRKISKGQGYLSLKSRSIEFRKKDFVLNLPQGKQSKRVYIKLNSPINKSLNNKLEKQGIILKEYVSENTYIADIDENKFEKLRNTSQVQGFADIDIADKMDESLYRGNFSSYLKDGNLMILARKLLHGQMPVAESPARLIRHHG